MQDPFRPTHSPTHPSGPLDSFHVRRLEPADLGALVELQRDVTAPLPPGFVRPKTPEELGAYLEGAHGDAFGVLGGDGWLAAAGLLRRPTPERPNSGFEFPLVPGADWPLYACFVENALVGRAARGRGLQRVLFDVRRARAARAGMRWICAGVHLDNRQSWANLLKMGMAIVGIRFDQGYPLLGLLTAVDAPLPAVDHGDLALVGAQDAERHEARLADGYAGIGLAHDGAVIYARRIGYPDK